jgi:alpha-aminoadipic semialdehyde synthase
MLLLLPCPDQPKCLLTPLTPPLSLPSLAQGHVFDVGGEANRGQLEGLVKDADVVVSLLPAPLHPMVAELCIGNRKNMVTASYVSPAIKELHSRCVDADICILNEVGLDPGMDHMSAMKIMDDVKERGGRIKHFSSVCGGLPAPEAANNPLM